MGCCSSFKEYIETPVDEILRVNLPLRRTAAGWVLANEKSLTLLQVEDIRTSSEVSMESIAVFLFKPKGPGQEQLIFELFKEDRKTLLERRVFEVTIV